MPVEAIVPTEGMTGWADTWMLSRNAKHPNCMLKWMAWMVTPQVQAQVAEYFGEAPGQSQGLRILDAGFGSYEIPDFCNAYHVTTRRSTRRSASGRPPAAIAATAAARPACRTTSGLTAFTD